MNRQLLCMENIEKGEITSVHALCGSCEVGE